MRSFFTATLSWLKSTGLVSNIRISNFSNFLHTLLKSFANFLNLSIANLSMSDFTLPKLTYLGKSAVTTLLSTVFFRLNFVIYLDKSNLTYIFFFLWRCGFGK